MARNQILMTCERCQNFALAEVAGAPMCLKCLMIEMLGPDPSKVTKNIKLVSMNWPKNVWRKLKQNVAVTSQLRKESEKSKQSSTPAFPGLRPDILDPR